MKIILIDTDENYANKLVWYLGTKMQDGFKFVSYTDIEKLLPGEYYKQNNKKGVAKTKNILLLSEDILIKLREYKSQITAILDNYYIIMLTYYDFIDENIIKDSDIEISLSIFKFQSAIKIQRILLEYISKVSTSKIVSKFGNTTILGVFSPIGRSGKTSLALSLALSGARKRKTLFISFEEYALPWLEKELRGDYLSELIYMYKSDKLTYENLNKEIYSKNNLSIITGLANNEDIEEIDITDIRNIIEQLLSYKIFEIIIIDFASLNLRAMKLFDLCKIVYITKLNDDFSRFKFSEFNQKPEDKMHKNIREVEMEKLLDFKLTQDKLLNLNFLITSKLYCFADKLMEEIKNFEPCKFN